MEPLTAALGASALLGLVGAGMQAGVQREGIAAEDKRYRTARGDIKKASGPEAGRAKKRLAKGDYGTSEAEQRELADRIARMTDVSYKAELDKLARGDTGPYSSGRRERIKRELFAKKMGARGQALLEGIRQGEQAGAQRRAEDLTTVRTYGANRAGIQSAAPRMMYQSTPFGSSASMIGQNTIEAFAKAGYFDKDQPDLKGSSQYAKAKGGE